jgi:hypothetical protein
MQMIELINLIGAEIAAFAHKIDLGLRLSEVSITSFVHKGVEKASLPLCVSFHPLISVLLRFGRLYS